jgi:hypothetical protein
MGINDRQRNNREERKNGQAEARQRRNTSISKGTPADWGSVSGELLTKAVAAVARKGGALRLGYTRDGGAYAIGIYGDGEPFTEYVPPSDDMDLYLRGIVEDYE